MKEITYSSIGIAVLLVVVACGDDGSEASTTGGEPAPPRCSVVNPVVVEGNLPGLELPVSGELSSVDEFSW